MKFTATDDQVIEMFRLAINASKPMGAGHIHYQSGDFTVEEARKAMGELVKGRYIHADYVEGRMVKLIITRERTPSGTFSTTNLKPSLDYQSWCHKYPTYGALVAAAGGKVTQ